MTSNQTGIKPPTASLEKLGITDYKTAYWNLSPELLTDHTVEKGMGQLTDNGTLAINTGKFTGRAPNDRFIVQDAITERHVDWQSKFNTPVEDSVFEALCKKVCAYFAAKDIYVRDVYACDHPDYHLNIRVVTEYPWSNMFAYNMFKRPDEAALKAFEHEWLVLNAPGFLADPTADGVRSPNFAIVNFSKKTILIGGTGYTGEIKKGIFSVLNFLLPVEKNVLSMHCSANIGLEGDTAVFFGLSGTGKTTLSADPARLLIGDDEHGWADDGVFNFEGGCYAKTIGLSEEKEPDIFRAIRPGAILENIGFLTGTKTPDYDDKTITENTRVSYPITHIRQAVDPSRGGHPKHIFFLTCDAYGVLPPISRLTTEQAMYHFISGYTAKVAGTEVGLTEPQTTFSSCFGAPFLPLHPSKYADMLGERLQRFNTTAWLINTGWTGGPYGVGSRMSLRYTRAMITAAMEGQLAEVSYEQDPVFGLYFPTSCPNVPTDVLNPRNTWADKQAFDKQAHKLARAFNENFARFVEQTDPSIVVAGPRVTTEELAR